MKMFIANYMDNIKKAFCFNGKSSREDFWLFFFSNSLIISLLYGIRMNEWIRTLGYCAYNLFIFIPMTALIVRRLNDIRKSRFWALVLLIPFIGIIMILPLMCYPSVANPMEDESLA